MVDKLDEICAKYGLKVIGKAWHEQVDCNKFLPLLGIDSLLKAGTDATLSIPAGRYFPGGSFTIYGTLNLGDAAEMFTYQCVKKNVFYDVFGYTIVREAELNLANHQELIDGLVEELTRRLTREKK